MPALHYIWNTVKGQFKIIIKQILRVKIYFVRTEDKDNTVNKGVGKPSLIYFERIEIIQYQDENRVEVI